MELYRVFYPEDTGITEDDLSIVTIKNILPDQI